jgi:hypothetical protein
MSNHLIDHVSSGPVAPEDTWAEMRDASEEMAVSFCTEIHYIHSADVILTKIFLFES